jgi:multidrug efflux system outer membrane protein
VEAARVDVARYTELAAQDENALNLLAGSTVPADLLPEVLSAVAPLPDVWPGTSSEVLLRRPDILQAESLLKAANANIGAARAAFFPRISLTTAIGTASGDLSDLFKSGSLAWNYSPLIVMPIFDARTWSALRGSKVEREIVLAQYEGAIQQAFRDVANALAKRGTLGDQIEAQQSLVDAAMEAHRLSNARYEKGIDTYLNVLDAQRSLYAAQQQLIAIRLAELANQVRLYAVLGGGGDSVIPIEVK